MAKFHLEHQDFFADVFANIPGVILYHKSGICLHLEQERVTDLGTLPKACNDVPQYMPIEAGQMILLNDPYCGGSILSNFTLLYGININQKEKNKAEFVLGLKFAVRPALVFADSLDNEGLKVPPTPIFSEKEGLNQMIVEAIGAHPQAPESFKFHLEQAVDKLKNLKSHLINCAEIWDIDLSQKALQKYIHLSNEMMIEFLTRIKPQKAHYKEQWVTGESIKIEMEKEEKKLFIHFSEVEGSSLYNLTEAAVFGACFAAVMNVLEHKIPLNSGTLECVQIKLPQKSFLNANYPAPVYLGFTEASGLISNFVSRVLAKINKEFQTAEGNLGCCTIDFQFESGEHFYDRLPAGLGANKESDGSFAVDKWTHHDLQASIEDIEMRFPMLIRSTSIRPGSGGNGKYQGGPGMIRSYIINKNASLKWFTGLSGHNPDGFLGGNSGLGPQFILVRDNAKQRLESRGEMELQAGDRIDVLTAGGGGFGEE